MSLFSRKAYDNLITMTGKKGGVPMLVGELGHFSTDRAQYQDKSQSRPQSPRYPCPAERENEDLWEDAFELGISLAIDRACAVPPEVHKQ